MSTHSDGPPPASASGPDDVFDTEGPADELPRPPVSEPDVVADTEGLADELPRPPVSEPDVVADTEGLADELPRPPVSEPDVVADTDRAEEPPPMPVREPDTFGDDVPMWLSEPDAFNPDDVADESPPISVDEPDEILGTDRLPDDAPPASVIEPDPVVETEGFSNVAPPVAVRDPEILRDERPVDQPLETAPSEADEIIRTEGLTKIYQSDDGEDLIAVDHLDLSVCKGEIFGLLGPNGAGKTTTVGMLTTRVVPTSGRAIVGGVDVVAEPARAKHGIGVVHQANTLDRSLTVSENLYFHARYFGMTAKAATIATEEALERFRLGARRKSEVRTLSGGMARRLMVARAILHHPAVLFLDEPTAGLDPQSRLALWDIVQELHDEGQTIMLTTHYMEEADRFCNRVAIVDHGRILALDTPAHLKQSADLRHDSSSAAKAKLARLRALARVAEPDQLDDIVEHSEGGAVLLDPIVAPDTAEELFEGVTLESVFIELTGRDLRE